MARTRQRSSNFVWWLAAVTIIALGFVGFYFAIDGVVNGAVEFPSKRRSFSVSAADRPFLYWVCIAAWAAIGAFLVRIGWRARHG
jgi:hypothetical protein